MSREQFDEERLLPGDYVFLAFLTQQPMTSYEIKKGLEASVSHFWSTAHSVVYQQAARLERDGYIKGRAVAGARKKRVLSLTPKGRRAVVRWLRDPDAQDQLFSQMLVKVFFAREAGDLAATIAMLEAKREEIAELLPSHHAFLPELAREHPFPAITLDLGIRLYRTILDWIDDTIPKLEKETHRAR
jgi:DNA-binding PadR family transcriptional regulator